MFNSHFSWIMVQNPTPVVRVILCKVHKCGSAQVRVILSMCHVENEEEDRTFPESVRSSSLYFVGTFLYGRPLFTMGRPESVARIQRRPY